MHLAAGMRTKFYHEAIHIYRSLKTKERDAYLYLSPQTFKTQTCTLWHRVGKRTEDKSIICRMPPIEDLGILSSSFFFNVYTKFLFLTCVCVYLWRQGLSPASTWKWRSSCFSLLSADTTLIPSTPTASFSCSQAHSSQYFLIFYVPIGQLSYNQKGWVWLYIHTYRCIHVYLIH